MTDTKGKGRNSMIWEKIRNVVLSGVGTMLCAVAVVFAQAPCHGLLYEPKVPECLEKK